MFTVPSPLLGCHGKPHYGVPSCAGCQPPVVPLHELFSVGLPQEAPTFLAKQPFSAQHVPHVPVCRPVQCTSARVAASNVDFDGFGFAVECTFTP